VWLRAVAATALLGAVALTRLGSRRRALLRLDPRAPLLGAVSGAGLYAVGWALTRLGAAASEAAVLYRWRDGHSAATLAATVVVAAVGEELFWRGLVTDRLVRRMPVATGVLVGSALYALAHVTAGSWLLVLAAFGAGVVWSALVVATGGLGASIVSHALFDLAAMVLFPVVSS